MFSRQAHIRRDERLVGVEMYADEYVPRQFI